MIKENVKKLPKSINAFAEILPWLTNYAEEHYKHYI